MYGRIEEGVDKDGFLTMRVCSTLIFHGVKLTCEQVMGAVDVKQMSDREVMLEWDSSASNDMIADSTLALISGIDKSPASVKCPSPFLSPRFLPANLSQFFN